MDFRWATDPVPGLGDCFRDKFSGDSFSEALLMRFRVSARFLRGFCDSFSEALLMRFRVSARFLRQF